MEVEEATESPTGLGVERRSMPRCVVDEEAVLLLVGHGGWVKCRIVELGLAGCRISTMERLPLGNGHRVEAVFKLRGVAFRFIGVSEWSDEQNLVGIRFVDMPTRRRDELVEVLCEVEAEEAGRPEKLAAAEPADEKRDAAEQADREQFAAEIRLAAERREEKAAQEQAEWQLELKSVARAQRSNEVYAAAEQNEAEARQAALEPFGPPAQSAGPLKRERRQQARHEVDTSAVILLIDVSSLLNGRIVDLSLGGCRIRTDEKFPVGIYTRVETEFRLGGMPFRLGGVIQAVHDRDRRNVGIRFLDISARKREQVEQLIEEIEELRVRQAEEKAGESGL
jgi:c-di-GMP-binding flagellar brake protein YcgR